VTNKHYLATHRYQANKIRQGTISVPRRIRFLFIILRD